MKEKRLYTKRDKGEMTSTSIYIEEAFIHQVKIEVAKRKTSLANAYKEALTLWMNNKPYLSQNSISNADELDVQLSELLHLLQRLRQRLGAEALDLVSGVIEFCVTKNTDSASAARPEVDQQTEAAKISGAFERIGGTTETRKRGRSRNG